MDNNLDTLIDALYNNDQFPLVPHHPNPKREDKFLFDFFSNLKQDLLVRQIEPFEHEYSEKALTIIKHYKGDLDYFNNGLDFDTYSKIKSFLSESSILKYKEKFYIEYANLILSDKSDSNDMDLIDFIFEKDMSLFLKVALKLDLHVISKIFNKDATQIFPWINNHSRKYDQLKELNQPQYIFDNMNGKLDINEDTLKYIFEICPVEINVYKELKKSLGLEIIHKYTYIRLTSDFYMELAESIDEFIFVLGLPNLSIIATENFLKRLKAEFPHLYENFNSLMLLKKGIL